MNLTGIMATKSCQEGLANFQWGRLLGDGKARKIYHRIHSVIFCLAAGDCSFYQVDGRINIMSSSIASSALFVVALHNEFLAGKNFPFRSSQQIHLIIKGSNQVVNINFLRESQGLSDFFHGHHGVASLGNEVSFDESPCKLIPRRRLRLVHVCIRGSCRCL